MFRVTAGDQCIEQLLNVIISEFLTNGTVIGKNLHVQYNRGYGGLIII